MIDNRTVTPPGAVYVEGLIAMWGVANGRQHPAYPFFVNGAEGVTFSVCEDFLGGDRNKELDLDQMTSFQKHPNYPLFLDNHKVNKGKLRLVEHEQVDTVVLVGGGEVEADIMQYRDRATFVTLSRNQKVIPGDYYVGLESIDLHYNNLRGVDASNTIAILSTICNWRVGEMGWKEVVFYAPEFMQEDGMPFHLPRGNVSCLAMEFICRWLKPKKIIMVGMQHPVHNFYYWHGIELQSMCWFASRHNIEIWNCTYTTSVVCGLILGSLKEAFEE